jgi:hypothetical protein
METIRYALTYKQHRENKWCLAINDSMLIPHSNTSIDRLVRFINYGDNNQRATGMFTKLEHEINHKELNHLWQLFTIKSLGCMSQAKIIAR